MKKISTTMRFLLIFSLVVLTGGPLFAANSKYRIMWRTDPARSMVIGWDQTSGSNPVVYYGTDDFGTNWSAYPNSKTVDRTVGAKGMNNHFARLTGLQPNTAYYFVIRDSEGTSRRLWFKTAPADSGTRLSFIAGGDSRNNRTPRVNANKLVAKLRPHAVFFGGDMTDWGLNSQWINWMNDWQYTITADGRMTPIVATRGNHESSNSIIVDLFDVPSSNVYYALTFGGNLVRTYTLNTEMSIGGSQTDWLSSDLQANAGSVVWKMAQYHKPMRPHTSGKSEGNNQYNYWANLFFQYGMNLVVECDSHTAKTTWPVKPSTGSGSDEGFIRDDVNGTVYTGEGCWGAPLRSNDDDKVWTRNSGRFNQFKWIFIDQSKIEMRTILVDNADQVGSVSDANIFAAPANLNIWNPSNGAVVTINRPGVSAPSVSITSPANNTNLTSPGLVTIEAAASDADGSISQVEFFVNGAKIGTDYAAPFNQSYNFATSGSYVITARATDNQGLTTTSNPLNLTVGVVSSSVSVRINSSNDDVEERQNGDIYTNSSDLELVYDSYASAGNQTVGMRFRNVGIPKGATITRAYVQFTTDETTSESTSLTIRGEASDNAPAFSTSDFNVSSRPRTSASAAWAPAAWNSTGVAGTDQRTPELKTIIQEITSRSGWNSGNSLAIIITGSGRRTAEAYDGSASQAPLLYVEYTLGTTDANSSPIVNLTAPAASTAGTVGGTVTLAANASDSDGSVTRVDFKVNGQTVKTDFAAPFIQTWSPASAGNYTIRAVAYDNKGATAESAPVTLAVQEPATSITVERRITSGADDVEENEWGGMYTNSSDLEMAYDGWFRGDQYIGMRFRNLGIPKGAVITRAYIQFTVDETNDNSCNLKIWGENTGNAAAFSDSDYNVTSRGRTSNYVLWSPSDWNSTGETGSDQRTPELKQLVQEIVNRSDYDSNGAMAFIVTGNGKRTAEAYEGSSSNAPLLHIEYLPNAAVRVAQTQVVDLGETLSPSNQLIYPNPFFNKLTIQLAKVVYGKPAVVTITGLDGREMFRREYNVEGETLELEAENLPVGMYLLTVQHAGETFTTRVKKQ